MTDAIPYGSCVLVVGSDSSNRRKTVNAIVRHISPAKLKRYTLNDGYWDVTNVPGSSSRINAADIDAFVSDLSAYASDCSQSVIVFDPFPEAVGKSGEFLKVMNDLGGRSNIVAACTSSYTDFHVSMRKALSHLIIQPTTTAPAIDPQYARAVATLITGISNPENVCVIYSIRAGVLTKINWSGEDLPFYGVDDGRYA